MARPAVINKRNKSLLDKIIYIFVILTVVFTVPQAYQVYSTNSASDLVMSTWIVYLFGCVAWLAYGIKHKELPLIVMNGSLVVLDSLIVVGIILYG